jgi:phenylacetate-coenzyme A ligase PaaK-like adenylate-forming protein
MLRLIPPPAPPLSLPATTPLPVMVERLNALQPWRIGAYASTLALLAGEVRAGRLRIAPDAVMSCGEPLLPEVRAEVEATLGAPIYDYWGMSEGMYAMPCGPGPMMHLPDDLAIVEPVDDAGRPVPPGEPAAKILLTSLFNLVQPLIRYEVTDRVRVQATPCACGSAFTPVGGIDGRADDVFTYGGGIHVHPLTLRAPLGRERHVTEYQVCQTPAGAHVRVCVNGPIDQGATTRALEERLREAGVAAPRVPLEIVPGLARQVSGKLKRFVPLA